METFKLASAGGCVSSDGLVRQLEAVQYAEGDREEVLWGDRCVCTHQLVHNIESLTNEVVTLSDEVLSVTTKFEENGPSKKGTVECVIWSGLKETINVVVGNGPIHCPCPSW